MSYETYHENEKKRQNKQAEADIAQYEKDNAALKEKVNASLDAAAESQAGVYRQEIEQAPLDSRALYDQNAMREAVDRKKIRESLANMGMTDSGLTSSMQTALTIQKSRADNSVRAAEQQRIRAAESAIDQIYADKELQKAQKGIEIDQDTAAYARTRQESANTLATQTATALHNAEVEAATARYEASLAAEQEWMKQQLSGQQDTAKLRSDYVKLLMTREENPMSSTAAWQEAYKAYPDMPVMSQAQYGYYTHYLNSGYSSEYANAMAKAYMNTAAAGGTEEQANQAVVSAMIATAEDEARKAGVDLQGGVKFGDDIVDWQGGVYFGNPIREKSNPTAAYAARIASANMAKLADKQLSDTGRMYATACMTGAAYAEILNDANVQKIGEALAQNFSGIYLEIALSYAGLE